MAKKLTTQEFIEKARIKHNNKYGYKRAVYLNSKSRVKIDCPLHGEFIQVASEHLFGYGCNKCAQELRVKSTRLTHKGFLKKANELHNNKYDYSLSRFDRVKDIIKIICPVHGVFKQRVSNHLDKRSKGCQHCAKASRLKAATKTTSDFIREAKLVHGDKYSYVKSIYKKGYEKTEIICSKHGSFFMAPHNHINQKQGCPSCGIEITSNKNLLTTEYFVKKAKSVHGSLFSYLKSIYNGQGNPTIITCRKHGDFTQTPNDHYSGAGCPMCNESKGERQIRKFLKENNIKYVSQKRFKNCKKKSYLPFDFHIENKNLLIEYQGRQHLKPVKFFGGQKGFVERQENDKIKKDFCLKSGIKLLEITYKDYKRIDSILKKHILSN